VEWREVGGDGRREGEIEINRQRVKDPGVVLLNPSSTLQGSLTRHLHYRAA
jgi:hypothetical protein